MGCSACPLPHVPERGARVHVPPTVQKVLGIIERFTSPLRPDDYIELISPLWSTEQLRGRIQRVRNETDDAVTLFIAPGWRWPGHKPGQYIRVGFDIEGKRLWRAYSLSSDAARPDGEVTITVKKVDAGAVSPYLHERTANGSIVTLGQVEGEFVLPEQVPEKLLFITAGSGITPVRAMLSHLARQDEVPDTIHLHSARTRDGVIFHEELEGLAAETELYRFDVRVTGEDGRIKPSDLDELVPDWRERETYACGPGELLDALRAHYEEHDVAERIHIESFEHMLLGEETGEGGEITFANGDKTVEADGSTPILIAGEDAGLELPYGCRMGICHTCTGVLSKGTVRDLRTGELTQAGTEVRTCISAAEGPCTIDL